ncbi:MAG: hypothetical protein AB7K24_24505 [Gemmataceae bacterium]
MAFGAMEIVLLLLLGSGNPFELVSAIDVDDYFKSRQVEVKTDKMIALATTAPKTGKDQIMQLLAIRWLSTSADKNQAAVKTALADVAAGKKGKDPLGFAEEHAQIALDRIAGKPTARAVPRNSVRSEALQWFPEKSNFFAVLDSRHAEGSSPLLDQATLRARFVLAMPLEARKEIYDQADKLGNVRLDRIAFAYQPEMAAERGKDRLYFRFTGKADPQRLADLLKQLNPDHQLQEKKGEGGEAIRILSAPGKPPAFAFIGTGDLVMAGFNDNKEDHLAVLEEVLATRKQGKSVVNAFANRLRKVPADASVLLMGDVNEQLQRSFERSPLPASPKTVYLFATLGKNVTLNMGGDMPDADAAKGTTKVVDEFKQNALQLVKVFAQRYNMPDEHTKAVLAAVETIKREADGTAVSASIEFSPAALKAVREVAEEALKQFAPSGSK